MVVTSHFDVVHIPKCGGTWVREVLRPIMLSTEENAIPVATGKAQIGFIRDPFSWHHSWYHFCSRGSMHYTNTVFDIFHYAAAKHLTLDEFVRLLNDPSSTYKKRLVSVAQDAAARGPVGVVHFRLASLWLDSDKSFYEHLAEVYLSNCTAVGKVESIAEDLRWMLGLAGVIDERVLARLDTPPVNVGFAAFDRNVYSEDSLALIAERNAGIIGRYYS